MSTSDESMQEDPDASFENSQQRMDDEDEDVDDTANGEEEIDPGPPSFAAALGLHRVGTVLPTKPQAQKPIQVLNARGMPARIRKKNKLFYDDDQIVNDRPIRSSPSKRSLLKPTTSAPSSPKTPSKGLKKRKGVMSRYMKIKEEEAKRKLEEAARQAAAASKVATNSAEIEALHRKMFQRLGLRLRNLLKLPKAHKWVSYEWFYSYIDKPLFEGENEFQACLRTNFPQLKTRKLTRAEWSQIRTLIGKPRRCSAAFFAEERAELERRRQKLRLLQTRKSADASFVRDMPNEIPLPLPIGTKVTARLRYPQDGIYTGSVDAVDSLTSSYRITFDRPGLGTHTVPDIELQANDFAETRSLQSLVQDLRPNPNGSYAPHRRSIGHGGLLSANKNDPLLGSEIYNNSKLKGLAQPADTMGGFPIKLLELIIRTKKTLVAKQMKLLRLKNMNTEAEMCRSFAEPLPEDFQRRYASTIIGMEKLNRDMHGFLTQVQTYTTSLSREPLVAAQLAPSYMRERCKELAVETVRKNNHIKDSSMERLIVDLAGIMWVSSNMAAGTDQMAQVTQTLEVFLEETRNRLHPENVEVFEKNVHVHMRHIEQDLRQGGSSTLANRLS